MRISFDLIAISVDLDWTAREPGLRKFLIVHVLGVTEA